MQPTALQITAAGEGEGAHTASAEVTNRLGKNSRMLLEREKGQFEKSCTRNE